MINFLQLSDPPKCDHSKSNKHFPKIQNKKPPPNLKIMEVSLRSDFWHCSASIEIASFFWNISLKSILLVETNKDFQLVTIKFLTLHFPPLISFINKSSWFPSAILHLLYNFNIVKGNWPGFHYETFSGSFYFHRTFMPANGKVWQVMVAGRVL